MKGGSVVDPTLLSTDVGGPFLSCAYCNLQLSLHPDFLFQLGHSPSITVPDLFVCRRQHMPHWQAAPHDVVVCRTRMPPALYNLQ